MKKIYFPNAWGESNVLKMFIHQTPSKKGVWDNITSVTNKNEADYIIVQDSTNEDVDYKKVIYFGREPSYVQHINPKWLNSKCYRYFHHEKDNSWMPQTWWLGLDFDSLSIMKNFEKNKNLSMIESGKNFTEGHRKRNRLLKKLVEKYPNNIDVYGKITMGKKNIKPYKTILPYRKKELGLMDYRYNLAIENGKTNNYFTEKVVDPLLCWSMPIYWGCNNIEKFLPKGSFIHIDINKDGVEDEIIEISKSNLREESIELIAEARDLILHKYNLWPTIKRAIENDKMF